MVTFSHVIFYVANITASLSFYEKVFDFKPKFIHESNEYAELDTGKTVIAFASEDLGKMNLPKGYIKNDIKQLPLACEIAFTVPNVQEFYEKALKAGATSVVSPEKKPWGQLVAYVRDPNGILVEIASDVS